VRRLLASSLLALFGFSLISAAFPTAAAESNLPACCRRAGKHHCGTPGETAPPAGPAFQAGDRCPYFPGSFTAARSPGVFDAIVLAALRAPLANRTAERFPTQPIGLMSLSGPQQKRGPPSLLSIG
jgi:hypothetical protein